VSATPPTPSKVFTMPNSPVPMRYSASVTGETIRDSRLRDQVSSRKPADTAICAW
jgi:hypothetical protein